MDETNRKKLEALGRTLPKRLPVPEPASKRKEADRRHPVETSQDPGQLFYELMGASPDGAVPAHMLARLRDLELQQQKATASGEGPPSGSSEPTTEQDLYLQFQQQLDDDDD